MSNDDLWRWDAVDLARAIRTRKISSREAVTSVLARLERVNGALNAVTVVLGDEALDGAGRADEAVRSGAALGSLHGVPVTIKENIDMTGLATVNGVPAFEKVVATDDSPPVRAWKSAGAIVVGRTNTPAFSLRWHTDNELRGRTFNPWARARTPGGSSGGAAAALAAGIAPLAHGNDYGGSIRYPAYCCGVAGIRPTLGRVGAFNKTAPEERPLTGQLMSVQGPMARHVRDVRAGLAAMATRDARDPWWVPAPLDGPPPARPIRVAVTVDPARGGVHPSVASAVRAAARALEHAGYAVEEVEPPAIDAVADLWGRLVMNETRVLVQPAIRQYGGADVNRSLDLILAMIPELDLASYMRGLAERARHVRDWVLFMERYPLVVGPVSTEPPFVVGFDVTDAATTARVCSAQRLLVAVNLLGLPAVSVPSGAGDGVPLGVQVIAGRYREDLALDAAEAIEAQCGVATPVDC